MVGSTHAQNPIIVEGSVSVPSDAVPVLDIKQLCEAANFLRAGCPAVQLVAKQGWAGGSLGEKEQEECLPRWTAEHQVELEGFLNTVRLPGENFFIEPVARALKDEGHCIIVYTVTRRLVEV